MSKKRVHKTLSLEEKLMILDELSSKTHRQLAEIRHLYIANTHYNNIHYYYNDIHYFNNPNISLIRPPSGLKLFGLVRVYCTWIQRRSKREKINEYSCKNSYIWNIKDAEDIVFRNSNMIEEEGKS